MVIFFLGTNINDSLELRYEFLSLQVESLGETGTLSKKEALSRIRSLMMVASKSCKPKKELFKEPKGEDDAVGCYNF